MNYFVTAIGTDSGKTVISAVLAEMLEADYWKPVQAGYPRDTETAMNLVSNPVSRFYNEAYLLQTPASPHASAGIDGVQIDLEQIIPPISNRDLVIEGAGGVLVPLNDKDVVIDMVPRLNAQIILVSNLYLGSINHTLLTAQEIKIRGLDVKGIIFNGDTNPESEAIIKAKTGWKVLLHVPQLEAVSPAAIVQYAVKLKENWK